MVIMPLICRRKRISKHPSCPWSQSFAETRPLSALFAVAIRRPIYPATQNPRCRARARCIFIFLTPNSLAWKLEAGSWKPARLPHYQLANYHPPPPPEASPLPRPAVDPVVASPTVPPPPKPSRRGPRPTDRLAPSAAKPRVCPLCLPRPPGLVGSQVGVSARFCENSAHTQARPQTRRRQQGTRVPRPAAIISGVLRSALS